MSAGRQAKYATTRTIKAIAAASAKMRPGLAGGLPVRRNSSSLAVCSARSSGCRLEIQPRTAAAKESKTGTATRRSPLPRNEAIASWSVRTTCPAKPYTRLGVARVICLGADAPPEDVRLEALEVWYPVACPAAAVRTFAAPSLRTLPSPNPVSFRVFAENTFSAALARCWLRSAAA